FYGGTWIFLLLTLSLMLAEGGKILVVPQDGSHWLSMRPVVEKLQQKGHEVVVVVPATSLYMKSKEPQNYTVKVYPIPYTGEYLDEMLKTFVSAHFIEQSVIIMLFWKLLGDYRKSGTMFHASCKSLLYSQELMKYIGDSHFDALLTDPVSPCGQIIALHFSIPSVFFLRMVPCAIDAHAAQGPDPPSYVPRMFSENTDHMTFSERVRNFLIALSESFSCSIAYSPFEELASEFLRKPMTMTELLSHGSIWLRRIDFVFEYPMPIMPNMVFIGGIHCGEKKKPLSQ
ncbi:UD11 glucuronosyltransferase, partial [Copsychus sechellarum]|nr:UD11 glucuronosyltransferase [Copsychus sechellarum]